MLGSTSISVREAHWGLFSKKVNTRLAKRPLVFNGHLAKCGLTPLVKEPTRDQTKDWPIKTDALPIIRSDEIQFYRWSAG